MIALLKSDRFGMEKYFNKTFQAGDLGLKSDRFGMEKLFTEFFNLRF